MQVQHITVHSGYPVPPGSSGKTKGIRAMELIELPTGEKYVLAQDLGDVERFLFTAPTSNAIGMDTETTGLDSSKDKIVGLSIAVEEKCAIYVPVAHKIGTNVSLKGTLDLVDAYMADHKVYPVFWNGKFDVSMFDTNVAWVPSYYEDVMASVYLDNPDREEKGLKACARDDLGLVMDEFESLFSLEERRAKIFDISTKAPRRCTKYAAQDADATLRLHNRYKHIKDEFSLPHRVDTKLMDIIRRMEQTGGMELNLEYINKCLKQLKQREQFLQDMVFRAAGQEFAIGSSKQLGDILFEKLGMPSPGRTKGGQHATGAKELEKLAEQYPVAEWVVSFKKIQKAQGSYFGKLLKLHEKGVKPRFSFNQFAAPTYRLAAPGGDPDLDGKTGVNIQAVSNGEARALMACEISLPAAGSSSSTVYQDELDQEDNLFAEEAPKVITVSKSIYLDDAYDKPWVWDQEDGTKVCVMDNCKHCDVGCAEGGLDVTRRHTQNIKVVPSVRQSFRAPKGYVLLGCDYDRQELVIGANLSKEPKWVNALLNNSDLHAITAMAAYKLTQDQWDKLPADLKKRRRGVGKILNFATFYGATAHTLARNTGLSLPVAQAIYDGFVKGHPQLFSWMDRVKLFARKNGYTNTYFGRRRWLKQFYNEGSQGMKAFADRSAVNTAVQGTGADVTRIAMVKCDTWLQTNQVDWDQARIALSIHDELVFQIKEDLLDTIGPKMVENMMFNVKGWAVQLSVEPKVGVVWGQAKKYSFKSTESRILTPD